MQICSRCLYTSHHPLHLTFDDEGVCSGCRVHEEKDQLDWAERATRLGDILKDYRCTSGLNYDCIVPVSGARDSYFVVHTIKNVYGMNPLLVTYNKHYNTAVGVRNLANLRIRFNCDLMTLTVNPQTVKEITRSTLRRFGSLYWHCIAGQTVYPVQIATKFKIPLIIWGAHQGLDQVGMFSHLDEVEMTRKYRKEHDLMGYEAEDLVDDLDNIQESNVKSYVYPDNREIEQVGVRGIYLNNYIRWDSRKQHDLMIREYGYQTLEQTRTFDAYNDVDCWCYSDIHDFIKLCKHGYGKVIDHACRDIRLGHITRNEALVLVQEFINRPPRHLDLFLEWIGATKEAFNYVVDQFRNPNFWRRDDGWRWQFSSSIFRDEPKPLDTTAASQSIYYKDSFLQTKRVITNDPDDRFILIGKGAS